jgi:predicted GNAT family acetyltransferase
VDDLEVRDEPEEARYAARAGGRLAGFAVYRLRPRAIVLTHTEVLAGFEGRGVGGALARTVLDDARARGLSVVPYCPFIAAWIRRHPGYEDLVPASERTLLERRRSP